jgi:uroporphyrinogen-III synthase
MPPPREASPEPLAGFTVGVTAERRHEELITHLERRGARVVFAPAIRMVPVTDDNDLLEATRGLLDEPADDLIVTTGIGFRSWLEAAREWGLSDGLLKALNGLAVLARGTRARAAVRAAGVVETWASASERSEDLLRHMLEEDLTGRRVAVQVYGEPAGALTAALRRSGAQVIELPVHRWAHADDPTPLRRLVGQAVAGTVDAITFTSAPGVLATLAVAEEDGLESVLVETLRGPVCAACVGRAAAAVLADRGIPAIQPARARLDALVTALATDLPARRARTLAVRGHSLELRGHAVVIDGRLRPIAPAPMAILRALARKPGNVVSRAELCDVLPSRMLPSAGPLAAGRPNADEHAVEMAVARLRRGLGGLGIVETVVKRGYRLACDPR